jgi:hypothetical protein
MLNRINKMKLPDFLLKRNGLLRKYTNLRIKVFELEVLALQENTDKYEKNIQAYYEAIEELNYKINTIKE